MNDLLQFAVDAHGGLDRWNKIKHLEADVSIGGAIWHFKNRPDVLKDAHVSAELHEQRISTFLNDQGRRLTLESGRVIVRSESDNLEELREHPRAAFVGQTADTPWDDFHVGYFSNYALWTYLTIPFLYTYSRFSTEELAPWHEDGEIWRPLKVRFPSNIETHTLEQVSYFGPDGLLRRHEYTVDVLGGAQGANYAYEYRDVDGIQFPTRRRVFAFDSDKRKVSEPLFVSIDLSNITLS